MPLVDPRDTTGRIYQAAVQKRDADRMKALRQQAQRVVRTRLVRNAWGNTTKVIEYEIDNEEIDPDGNSAFAGIPEPLGDWYVSEEEG